MLKQVMAMILNINKDWLQMTDLENLSNWRKNPRSIGTVPNMMPCNALSTVCMEAFKAMEGISRENPKLLIQTIASIE